jgi:GTP cyclohydrolase I
VVGCRNRAEILRIIAENTPNESHRESLRRVAEYYDAMAASLEREIKNAASKD